MAELNRQEILAALHQALEPLPFTHAMWEAGAAAFNRIDQWSDIDLLIDVEEGKAAETWQAIEAALRSISPIEQKLELPRPNWHGNDQRFYRLAGAGPYLMLDIVMMEHTAKMKFLEAEQHGRPQVWFDKHDEVVSPPFDRDAFTTRLEERLQHLKKVFDMFQILILKELNRGNLVEALSYYQVYTLRPLIEALRFQYKPLQYNFQTRYIYYDFPEAVVSRLEALAFVCDGPDLQAKHKAAGAWFWQLIQEIEVRGVEYYIEKTLPENR